MCIDDITNNYGDPYITRKRNHAKKQRQLSNNLWVTTEYSKSDIVEMAVEISSCFGIILRNIRCYDKGRTQLQGMAEHLYKT